MKHDLTQTENHAVEDTGALAKNFSAEGIPCLVTDFDGTLPGVFDGYPCTLWDLYGESGLPLRTTVTELGPTLLSCLLELNEKQSELLRIIFKIADDAGLLLVDTKDLKAVIGEISENNKEYQGRYGTLDRQSLAKLLHAVVALETGGAEKYIFEPAIDIRDMLKTEGDGRGRINVLDASGYEEEPRVYACMLMFLLGELYENPECMTEGIGAAFIFDARINFLEQLPENLLKKQKRIISALKSRGVQIISAQSSPLNGKVLSGRERQALIEKEPLHEKYKIPFDRDSAYEFLKRRGLEGEAQRQSEEEKKNKDTEAAAMAKRAKSSAKSLGNTVAGTLGRSVGKSIGSSFGTLGTTLGGNIGASLGRGIINTLFKS